MLLAVDGPTRVRGVVDKNGPRAAVDEWLHVFKITLPLTVGLRKRIKHLTRRYITARLAADEVNIDLDWINKNDVYLHWIYKKMMLTLIKFTKQWRAEKNWEGERYSRGLSRLRACNIGRFKPVQVCKGSDDTLQQTYCTGSMHTGSAMTSKMPSIYVYTARIIVLYALLIVILLPADYKFKYLPTSRL